MPFCGSIFGLTTACVLGYRELLQRLDGLFGSPVSFGMSDTPDADILGPSHFLSKATELNFDDPLPEPPSALTSLSPVHRNPPVSDTDKQTAVPGGLVTDIPRSTTSVSVNSARQSSGRRR